jgi:hypothetical protein
LTLTKKADKVDNMTVGKYTAVLSKDGRFISFYDKHLCVASYLCRTLKEDTHLLTIHGLNLRSGRWTLTGDEMKTVLEYIK